MPPHEAAKKNIIAGNGAETAFAAPSAEIIARIT
jgi:hypothetical protein